MAGIHDPAEKKKERGKTWRKLTRKTKTKPNTIHNENVTKSFNDKKKKKKKKNQRVSVNSRLSCNKIQTKLEPTRISPDHETPSAGGVSRSATAASPSFSSSSSPHFLFFLFLVLARDLASYRRLLILGGN